MRGQMEGVEMQEGPPVEQEMQGGPPVEQGVQESDLPTEAQNLSEEDQGYLNGLVKLMHSKKTAPAIEDMLESWEPEKSIPLTALKVNEMMEQEARKGGKPPSLELLFSSAIVVVSDLVAIGNAKGIFEVVEEEHVAAILQATIQQYVEKGLEEGTIDPVELQQKAEAMMTPEDREAGINMGATDGIPTSPNEHTAMEVYADRKVRKAGMLQGGRA